MSTPHEVQTRPQPQQRETTIYDPQRRPLMVALAAAGIVATSSSRWSRSRRD